MPEILNSREYWVAKAIEFVQGLGLPVTITEDADLTDTFIPYVRVEAGGLTISGAVFPGDILHEAGHLAVIPGDFRPLAVDSLSAVMDAMTKYIENNPHGLTQWPEDPLSRAILQSGEAEATAWQYAAAQAIGLPDEWLFPADSYDGGSAHVLQDLKTRTYLGVNGLQAAGWTVQRKQEYRESAVFPALNFWLHPGTLA
ncbi:hypothetical protein LC612_38995 [Nostoc sp. CHAB 5834]|nr:hypothetical protein [Nostoc sp. CHAB 5834]